MPADRRFPVVPSFHVRITHFAPYDHIKPFVYALNPSTSAIGCGLDSPYVGSNVWFEEIFCQRIMILKSDL